MGLDLYFKDESTCCRVGSYGLVHELRRAIASVASSKPFYEKFFGLEENSEIVKMLAEFSTSCEYKDEFHLKQLDLCPVYKGIIQFIYHSDCDGEHQGEELLNISKAFNELYFSIDLFDDDFTPKKITSLSKFFEEAVRQNKIIEYM